jgi:hypothetical protein
MDEDFVRKWLDSSLSHPTLSRERYVLCGPLVVFRAEVYEISDLSESDLSRAITIIAEHAV